MEYSMTFLARGVWGSLPIVTMSGPDWTIFSTSRRILRRSMSRFLRTLAATPGAFLDQAEEDVFGADVLVVEALGLLVGQLHHLAGAVREAFIHSSRLRQSAAPSGACRVGRRGLRTSHRVVLVRS